MSGISASFRLSPAAVAITVLCGVLAYQSTAHNAAAPPPPPPNPTVVVTVDLERVFKNITIRDTERAKLQAYAKELEATRQAKMKEARDKVADLDTLAKGTPAYDAAEKAATESATDAKVFTEYSKLKLDMKSGESLRVVYLEVKGSLAKFAQSNGYDLVLLDDAVRDVQKGSEDEVTQQISGRRMLYAAPALDVTEQFIEWMNGNTTKAG